MGLRVSRGRGQHLGIPGNSTSNARPGYCPWSFGAERRCLPPGPSGPITPGTSPTAKTAGGWEPRGWSWARPRGVAAWIGWRERPSSERRCRPRRLPENRPFAVNRQPTRIRTLHGGHDTSPSRARIWPVTGGKWSSLGTITQAPGAGSGAAEDAAEVGPVEGEGAAAGDGIRRGAHIPAILSGAAMQPTQVQELQSIGPSPEPNPSTPLLLLLSETSVGRRLNRRPMRSPFSAARGDERPMSSDHSGIGQSGIGPRARVRSAAERLRLQKKLDDWNRPWLNVLRIG
jgi:hypothetical protein